MKLVDQNRYYPRTDWIADLQYDANEIHPVTTSATGCPQVDVRLNGEPFQLIFDFGCSKGFQVTTAVQDRLHCTVLEETNTYHADGTIRGTVKRIQVDTLESCGRRYRDQEGTLADWRISSSLPYQGLIGLEYFADRRFTLDYRRSKLGLTAKPFPPALRDSEKYVVTEMPQPPDWHRYGIYVPGKVNGIDCTIHIDSGSSHTTVDPAVLAPGVRSGDRGRKPSGGLPVSLGSLEFRIKNYRVDKIRHPSPYQYPVRMGIGSDLLKYFVITVDRTENKNLLIIYR